MDNRDDYGYGWNKRGERFHAAVFCGGIIPPQINLLKVGQRPWRVNMIAAYCNRQLFAPFTIVGARNIEQSLKPEREKCLMAALKPGQWLVIDNATFHKGGRIEALLEIGGCKVLYLPPYSPDLNKIENCWSWLKSRIRHCKSEFDCLRDAMEYVLKLAS